MLNVVEKDELNKHLFDLPNEELPELVEARFDYGVHIIAYNKVWLTRIEKRCFILIS